MSVCGCNIISHHTLKNKPVTLAILNMFLKVRVQVAEISLRKLPERAATTAVEVQKSPPPNIDSILKNIFKLGGPKLGMGKVRKYLF